MNPRESTRIKKEVARRSPKGSAGSIRGRNQVLLDKLEAWHEEISTAENWDRIDSREKTVPYGCAHCKAYACYNCLWLLVAEDFETFHGDDYICCEIFFNGVTHSQVSGGDIASGNVKGFSIVYAWDKACIYFNPCGGKEFEHSYRRCKKFLEGHIEWTSWDCWGEKAEEEA